jgi:hypothetical protein
MDPGSEMGKKIRIRIRDKQPGSYSESFKQFLGLKYLNTCIWIRDGKIRIRDKHPGSATLESISKGFKFWLAN